MPTFFAYCRKSSEAEDRQILSIDSQVSELKRYAARKGIRIADVLTEAKSAKAPGRPVFNTMMQRMYRGEADGILCWKLDRLARNAVDGGAIIWAMKEQSMKIMTPFQTYGQSEDNVVWMYLEFGMAQKYVDDLSKNVKRGLRSKAEMGWRPCPPPMGYAGRQEPDGQKVIIKDAKRFGLIRKCWDLMLTGKYTPSEIRDVATTAWGFKTKRGRPLGRTSMRNIFSNPFYHGVYEYPKGSGTWHDGRHIPMVTEKEFDTVQRILARSPKMPKNRTVFAFTGLISCGNCGSAVTAEEKHQTICPQCRHKYAYRSKEACPSCKLPVKTIKGAVELHYTYYHCTKSQNPACNGRAIERKDLERQIIQILANLRMPLLHELWLNRSFARLSGSREEVDTLKVIRDSFSRMTPEIQRQIAVAVFSSMVLKDQKATVTLKAPFSFRKTELPCSSDQYALAEKAVQQQMAGA